MYTSAFLTAMLPLLAAAAPFKATRDTASSPYTVMALRSGSAIHFSQMNAANLVFNLGGTTSSYCPEEVGDACPPGNYTVFTADSGLSTEVPGGQAIYVAPSGALSYTQAHSASYPEGSVLNPLVFEPATGTFIGDITTSAFGATGLMACPTTTGGWQVFAAIQNATVPSGNVGDCLDFSAEAVAYTGPSPAAWQYE